MSEPKKKTTMSVAEMRRMLGLGKTDSYWLVHKNCFKTILVNGKMRVDIASFEKWYANQVKHKKVNGPPPGAELRAMSYSPQEIAELLHIDDASVYYLIKRDHIPTFKVDTWIRIRRTDFMAWYRSQNKHRLDEDRMRDRKAEENSLSMPEAAKELGISRNEVYQIFKARKNKGKFVFVTVGEQKRVTRKSFDAWYKSQVEYLKPEDRPLWKEKEKQRKQEKWAQNREQVDGSKDVFSVQEVALLLDKDYMSIYRMIRSGKIKAIQCGRSYCITKEEVVRLMFEQIPDRMSRKGGADNDGIHSEQE